jgi:hypothetical protein
MSRTLALALLILTLAVSVALAGPSTRWFHIRVEEKGENGETVRINLPVELVESILPIIDDNDFHHGTVRLDSKDVDAAQLRQMLAAVRDAEDGEYVTVDGPDEKVRIRKEDGILFINVDDRGEAPEQVNVKIRMDVLDAMLSGNSDELNIAAGLKKLGEADEGDLVTVYGDDETVHIWIDSRNSED